jgi:CheY-like chemotaxis protein
MNKTVLVIDDSSVLRDIMREVLEDAGFDVIEAPHGQLGLAQAQQHSPDIVLCDINMPVLDGYGFVQAARALEPLRTVPILMVTAMAEKKSMRRAMDAGADDFLTKPFTPEELVAAVSGQLAKRERHEADTERSLDRLRGALLTSVPHELRTPLTNILGYSQLLIARAGRMSADQQADMHRHIHESAQRLSRTIGRYMEWSELNAARGSGSLRSGERVDAQGLTDVLASKAFRALVLESLPGEWASLPSNDRLLAGRLLRLDFEPAQIHCHCEDLLRMLAELISNGIKFSVPGATVLLEGRLQPGGDYHIDVRNHGPGLPAQVQKVSGALIQFGRDQHEQQGSGLGLALCGLLAQRNGAGLQWMRTDGAPNVVRLKLAAGPRRE